MGYLFSNKLATIFLLPAMLTLVSNCSGRKTTDQWDESIMDANLCKDLVYKQLDKEKEIFSMCEVQDSLMRKTSNVSYFSGKRIDLNDTEYWQFNNCRAYFFKSDTLSIRIGIGNCFV